MTLLTKERWALLEQCRVDRPVWVMTVTAILGHRLVIPEERTAFFHVAGVAGFNHGVAGHHLRPGRAVRVVTVGAGHLAFDDRVT